MTNQPHWELTQEMYAERMAGKRATDLAYHDVIVLVDPLTLPDGRTYLAGDKLRVERTFTIGEPIMRLTVVGSVRNDSGRNIDLGDININGYDIGALKYTVIPAPDDEPF